MSRPIHNALKFMDKEGSPSLSGQFMVGNPRNPTAVEFNALCRHWPFIKVDKIGFWEGRFYIDDSSFDVFSNNHSINKLEGVYVVGVDNTTICNGVVSTVARDNHQTIAHITCFYQITPPAPEKKDDLQAQARKIMTTRRF